MPESQWEETEGSSMDDQERLLRASEDLDLPLQASAAGGAIRAAEHADESRPEGEDAPGSCTSWCGWGN
jgi:hypothetical protein